LIRIEDTGARPRHETCHGLRRVDRIEQQPLARGSRDYQLTAKLHFSTTVGQIDVDVTQSGQLGSSLASR
jgi:hypothetical protein